MSYEKRGSYNHRRMGKQLLRFDGISYGNVTPMDIDGFIEWHDKKRVMLEIKLQNVPILTGERLALERMVDDFARLGKESMAVIADHKVFDTNEDVIVRECLVREIYHSRERIWRPTKMMMTVGMLLDSFLLPS